jgi:hypothetical protein
MKFLKGCLVVLGCIVGLTVGATMLFVGIRVAMGG